MRIEKPYRAQRTHDQKYPDFPPEAVFPMLCPVREAEWIEDWSPEMVITGSGVAEPGCTFVTRADNRESVWHIVRHDPGDFAVEMIKVTPGVTVCHLRIDVRTDGGAGSLATVSYAHTALGPEGRQLVDEFTEEAYRDFMDWWEQTLTAFLANAA